MTRGRHDCRGDRGLAESFSCLFGAGAAADARHTLELLPALRDHGPPTLLIWDAEDDFQPVEHAERFADEVPSATLAAIAGAGHIPMEDDPDRVAGELLAFLEVITVSDEVE